MLFHSPATMYKIEGKSDVEIPDKRTSIRRTEPCKCPECNETYTVGCIGKKKFFCRECALEFAAS